MGYLTVQPYIVILVIFSLLLGILTLSLHWRRSFTVQLLASVIIALEVTIIANYLFNDLPDDTYPSFCIGMAYLINVFGNGLFGVALSCYIDCFMILSSRTFIDQKSTKMKMLKFLYFSLTYLLPTVVLAIVYFQQSISTDAVSPRGSLICDLGNRNLVIVNLAFKGTYTIVGSVFLGITFARYWSRIRNAFKGVNSHGTTTTTGSTNSSSSSSSASNYQKNLLIRLGIFCFGHFILAMPFVIYQLFLIMVVPNDSNRSSSGSNSSQQNNGTLTDTGAPQPNTPPKVSSIDTVSHMVMIFITFLAAIAVFAIFGTGKSVQDRYTAIFGKYIKKFRKLVGYEVVNGNNNANNNKAYRVNNIAANTNNNKFRKVSNDSTTGVKDGSASKGNPHALDKAMTTTKSAVMLDELSVQNVKSELVSVDVSGNPLIERGGESVVDMGN